jgi:CRISPR/Cas system-associated exonuclease Cas4 (RecB family)
MRDTVAVTRSLKSSALDRLKDTYKGKGVLLPRLERHVMRSITGARPDDHSTGHMHPSDMAKKDWCGRHDYYRIIGTPPERKAQANPSFRMANVFAEGHAIGGKYIQWMWEMGILIGDFQCKDCGHRWGDISPSKCQFCLSESLVYKEYPLRRNRYLVEGHADAATTLECLVEIKSIGIRTLAFEAPRLYQRYLDGTKPEDIWFEMNRPFPSHMRQGQLYLWMAWPVYEQIVFIYESKFHQQTKEFVVEYNKSLIAPLLETAKAVTIGVEQGLPPTRPSWAESPEGKVCASCEYRRTCWSLVDGKKADDPTQSVSIKRATSYKRRRTLRRSA